MEIERRWLVETWPDLTPASTFFMEQGYFVTHPAIRIRQEALQGGDTGYVLCFKGGAGLVREEIEMEVDQGRYQRLRAMIGKPMIQKEQRRYSLPGGLTLEVNSVDPQLETGFFYAEVEFPDEASALAWTPPGELAPYLSNEVTGQPGESMAAYWQRTRP